MKKNTPIKQVIIELENFKALGFITPDVKTGIDIAIEQCQKKLSEEKEQIRDAFDNGHANWDKKCRDIDTGTQYYNEVFINPLEIETVG